MGKHLKQENCRCKVRQIILCLVSVWSKKVANRMEAKCAKERMAGYEVREEQRLYEQQ